MKAVRTRVIAIVVSCGCSLSCSTAVVDRAPSWAENTNLKLVGAERISNFERERSFQPQEAVQDVRVCGELYKVKEDFYVRSQCRHGQGEYFSGVSKVPAELLLKESQGAVWMKWAEHAETQSKSGKVKAPFVCFIGRGNGDPCDKKSGSLIQRVRRFTSDENQFNSW